MEKPLYTTDASKGSPTEISREAFILHLADNALILGHRNSEWCGHGPVLEQDIAISNISLDLIGQARNFYQYAASVMNTRQVSPPGGGRDSREATEDSLAYFRDSPDFKNILLVEQPKGDWAVTVLRQFFFSAFQQLLFRHLRESNDEQIAAIAAKSLKEIAYHLRWSSEWVIRLGDGTKESHDRMITAINFLWDYTSELFIPAAYETALANEKLIPDVHLLKNDWLQQVKEIFDEATLPVPAAAKAYTGGKEGKHSPYLEDILTELQSVARAHPTASW